MPLQSNFSVHLPAPTCSDAYRVSSTDSFWLKKKKLKNFSKAGVTPRWSWHRQLFLLPPTEAASCAAQEPAFSQTTLNPASASRNVLNCEAFLYFSSPRSLKGQPSLTMAVAYVLPGYYTASSESSSTTESLFCSKLHSVVLHFGGILHCIGFLWFCHKWRET